MMGERSRTCLARCVVGVAISLGNLRRLSRSSWGVDHICEAIFSKEKSICQP
jgi:hypothetical protein